MKIYSELLVTYMKIEVVLQGIKIEEQNIVFLAGKEGQTTLHLFEVGCPAELGLNDRLALGQQLHSSQFMSYNF